MSGSTAYIGGDFGYVGPETGSFVALDAEENALTTPWPAVGGDVNAVAPDGVGGWFIGGEFQAIGSHPVDNLAHIKPDGTVDTDWKASVNGGVYALAVSGTTVFAGGVFSAAGGEPRSALAAFDATTGAVTSFDAGVIADENAYELVSALELSGTTLYVGGLFEILGGHARKNLGAVDVSTPLGTVTDWNPDVNSFVDTIAVGPAGTVYVGGFFEPVNGNVARPSPPRSTRPGPSRLEAAANGRVRALEMAGTEIYAGGEFTSIGGHGRKALAAVDATTGAATAWDPMVTGVVHQLAFSGSVVYAAGRFQSVGDAITRDNLAAFTAAGTGAPTPFGPVIAGDVYALAATGGTVVVGGSFVSAGGADPSLQPVRRGNLGAIDLATGKPTDWHGSVDNGLVFALAVADSTLIAGGVFRRVNGTVPRSDLASFCLTSSEVTAWNPEVLGDVHALALSGGNVYAGGGFGSSTARRRARRSRRSRRPARERHSSGRRARSARIGLRARRARRHDLPRRRLHLDRRPSAVAARRGQHKRRGHGVEPERERHGVRARALGLDRVRGRRVHHGQRQRLAAGRRGVRARRHRHGDRVEPARSRQQRHAGHRLRTRADGVDDVSRRRVPHGRGLRVVLLLQPRVTAVSLATGAPLTTWQPGADDIVCALGIAPEGLVVGGSFSALGSAPYAFPEAPVEPNATYRGGFALVHGLPDAPAVSAVPGDGSATVSHPAAGVPWRQRVRLVHRHREPGRGDGERRRQPDHDRRPHERHDLHVLGHGDDERRHRPGRRLESRHA